MDNAVETAKALAIVRQSRSPGFRELVALLDDLATAAKEEAFNCDDESRAVRLIHEGRGAAELVTKFKAQIARLENDVLEPHG
jgi:hypothetical protein